MKKRWMRKVRALRKQNVEESNSLGNFFRLLLCLVAVIGISLIGWIMVLQAAEMEQQEYSQRIEKGFEK